MLPDYDSIPYAISYACLNKKNEFSFLYYSYKLTACHLCH